MPGLVAFLVTDAFVILFMMIGFPEDRGFIVPLLLVATLVVAILRKPTDRHPFLMGMTLMFLIDTVLCAIEIETSLGKVPSEFAFLVGFIELAILASFALGLLSTGLIWAIVAWREWAKARRSSDASFHLAPDGTRR